MKRRLAALVLVLFAGAMPASASSVVSVNGVVVGGESTAKTLFVADSHGRVFLVLAPRFVPTGALVHVRGESSTPSWTIIATGSAGRLTRTGTATRALVHGELGFVDFTKRRFQLAAHGQIVADVSFPVRLGPLLQRLARESPQPRSLTFRLSIRSGRLSLAEPPH